MRKKFLFVATMMCCLCLSFPKTRKLSLEQNNLIENKFNAELYFPSGHASDIGVICYSPDGKYIATGSNDNTIKLWDVKTEKEIRSFAQCNTSINGICWSSDGKYIFCISSMRNGMFFAWEASSGNIKFEDQISFPTSIKLDSSGVYLAITCGGEDGGMVIYDVKTLKKIRKIDFSWATFVNWQNGVNNLVVCGNDAVYVYNALSGQLQGKIPLKNVMKLTYSPSGKMMAAICERKLKIWDANSLSEIAQFSDKLSNVTKFEWSPDEMNVAIVDGGNISVWNVTRKNEVMNLRNINSYESFYFSGVSWSPDGKFIACANKNNLFVLDSVSGKQVLSFRNFNTRIACLDYNPNNQKLIVAHRYDGNPYSSSEIWDAQTGIKELDMEKGHSSPWVYDPRCVAWSPDGVTIAEGAMDYPNFIRLLDSKSGKELKILESDLYATFEHINWSADGQFVVYARNDLKLNTFELKLYDKRNDKIKKIFSSDNKSIESVKWSPKGAFVACIEKDGRCIVINPKSGEVASTWTGVRHFAFTPDEEKFVVSNGSVLYVANVNDWKIMRQHDLNDTIFSLDVSPNAKYIVTTHYDHSARVFDMESWELVAVLNGNLNMINSVVWTSDSQKIVTGGEDGSIRFWGVSGELLYTVLGGKGGDWIGFSNNYFCGDFSDKNMVYFVQGMKVIEIDQLHETLYRPDLIAAKLRGENILEGIWAESLSGLVSSGDAPEVQIVNAPQISASRDVAVTFTVQNQGGGIGSVYIKLNGKVIKIADGKANADKNYNGKTVTFTHLLTLQNGENVIEAYATNSSEKIESCHASAKISWQGKNGKPNLYVLAVGVNKYRDRSLWLQYSVPDAEAVSKAFGGQKTSLYQNIYTRELFDGNVTKEGLTALFAELAPKVNADDVFILFIAGHGTTNQKTGDYYFIPSNFRYTDADAIISQGVSKDDILKYMSIIKAGKTLIMLDTCNSGAFTNDKAMRGFMEKSALERLVRSTGQAVLTAASEEQSAMEGYNGHGIFTYVLLEALSGKADRNKDGYLTLNELASYIEEQVPELSYKKWGYEQVPMKELRKQDFPLIGK